MLEYFGLRAPYRCYRRLIGQLLPSKIAGLPLLTDDALGMIHRRMPCTMISKLDLKSLDISQDAFSANMLSAISIQSLELLTLNNMQNEISAADRHRIMRQCPNLKQLDVFPSEE